MSVDRPEFLSLVTLAATYIHGHSVGGMNPSLVEAMGAGALIAALDTTFNRETVGDTGRFFAEDCADVVDVLRSLAVLSDDERTRDVPPRPHACTNDSASTKWSVPTKPC